MTKTKKSIFIIVSIILCLLITLCVANPVSHAYAEETNENTNYEVLEDEGNKEIAPRLLATLSLSLKGGDGIVIATVKNDFTLFPSTVYVIVQLFYSYSYCEDYNQMILADIKSTDDLDMGHTLVAQASTDGEERFWLARMRYREGKDDWDERTVSARYSADGTYMGIS